MQLFHINDTELYKQYIKLYLKAAQTCTLPLFCNSDLEINPMTLKLYCDFDIVKMYLQTENEAARSSPEMKKYKNSSQGQRSKSNVTNFQ